MRLERQEEKRGEERKRGAEVEKEGKNNPHMTTSESHHAGIKYDSRSQTVRRDIKNNKLLHSLRIQNSSTSFDCLLYCFFGSLLHMSFLKKQAIDRFNCTFRKVSSDYLWKLPPVHPLFVHS